MNDAGLITVIQRLLSAKTKEAAKDFVGTLGDDYRPISERLLARITFTRTLNQNALLHVWFGEIAHWHGDRDAKQVKGEMHHAYALDIRLRDPQFNWIWKHSGARLNYEQQCGLLASETLNVSSAMTTKELTEYMSAIERHYAQLGLALKVPEAA